MTDRVPDELWTEVRDIVQETGTETIPKKKKCKKAKWLSEEALQIDNVSHVQLFSAPWTVACQAPGTSQTRILEWVAISFPNA